MTRILITSALPYANGPLHFGHIAGAYLPGDCYARFERLMGNDVLYICGSDEYGVAIAMSAELAGRTPKEHVDHFHEVNKELFQTLDFSFDHYSRTTWSGHKEIVQEFFLDLLKNGYIEKKETNQLYSEKENKFLADRYVIGTCPKCGYDKARGDECPKCGSSYEATDLKHPKSKISGHPLVLKPTTHWFLRFDKFKKELDDWLSKKNWKPNVMNFAKSYVEDLRERAITRDSDWGIPVPLDEAKGKVLYVWFDAPIGYISATKEWAEKKKKPDLWKDYWLKDDTKLVQFIGKDNIPFHAVFFPAMIMGQTKHYKKVDELPANEFLNLEGRQFSKSEGWTIPLDEFFQHFTSDQIRYYLAANAPESQDAEFSWKDFGQRCNADLVGKFGNLANRVLVFARQHCDGKIPAIEPDEKVLQSIHNLTQQIADAYEHFHLRKACQLIMELATVGNVYFDGQKPWALAKESGKKSEMEQVIVGCLYCLRALALVSSPIIPKAAQKLWEMLGFSNELAKENWTKALASKLPANRSLGAVNVLFKKIEDEMIEEQITKLHEMTEKETPARNYTPLREPISFDEFKKPDIRVGKILAVEKVEKSQKLLKLSVDLGFEKRTIVSGIAKEFPDPQTLVGKNVLVVANLKPAKLMGIESQGMILTALGPSGLELLSPSQAEPGDEIL